MRPSTVLPVVTAAWLSLLGSARGDDVVSKPVCDVSIDSALCLHNDEQVLLPSARPYGLELHLKFDEVRPVDSSGMKNHGSGSTMVASGVGGMGSAALFRQNYVIVPHSPSFESSDFSYTFFVYLLEDHESRANNSQHDQFCPIVHKGIMRRDVEEAAPAVLFNPKDGHIKVVVGTTTTPSSAGEEMQSNSRLRPHQWYHIAVVRHVSRIRLYIDGILDSTHVTDGATRTNSLPLYVGSAPYAEGVCDTPMLMDNLRVYSTAIGRDQIQAEAGIVLSGIEPSFVTLGCVHCSKEEASSSCAAGYHLCDKLELFLGGYQVARKLSLGSNILATGASTPITGVGLCCSDS